MAIINLRDFYPYYTMDSFIEVPDEVAEAMAEFDRRDSISIESQIDFCKYELKGGSCKIFKDKGYSGKNTDRPEFQRLLDEIRKGKVRRVIVYKLDRISRSLSDFVNILQEFKEHKVEFVSSQESFDTSSPYGEMIVKLLMVFAEFERTSIINRVTKAYAHRSEMGFYMGGRVPYGY